MNKKSSLNNLLYIQEHRSCRNYLEKVENGFKYIESVDLGLREYGLDSFHLYEKLI